MKSTTTIVLLVVSVFIMAFQEKSFSQTEDDYLTIRNLLNEYYDSDTILKSTPGSGYKDFLRWDIFWGRRIGGEDTSYAHSDMNRYNNALQEYLIKKEPNDESNPWQVKWNLIGPPSQTVAQTGGPFYSQVMGIITALYVDKVTDPTGNTIYAGAGSSGLWKTNDRGVSWSNVTDALPLSSGVRDIIGDPNIPDIIYIASGTNSSGIKDYGLGVFKTIDGGSNWSQIFDPGWPYPITNKILINPNDGNDIFILVNDKVYRSTNGGNDWSIIFGDTNTPYFLTQDYPYKKKFLIDVEMQPGNPNTIYIASTGFEDWDPSPHYRWHHAEIWKTSNSLSSGTVVWNRLDSSNFSTPMASKRYELSVSPADSNCVYVIGADTIGNLYGNKKIRIYKTEDNGQSWKLRHSGEYYLYDELRLEFAVSPTDTSVLYMGGGYAHRGYSTGASMTFTSINSGHVDTRAMVLINGSQIGIAGINDTLLFGNDGGISLSSDGGRQAAQNINGTGLTITQFYGFGSTNLFPEIICGGTIDNGIFTDTSNYWFQKPGGGDAGDVIVHPKKRGTFYSNVWGSGNYGYGIKRTNNYWTTSQTWSAQETFHSEPSDYNRPLKINQENPDTMFAGFRNLYRTLNATYNYGYGAQWDSISRFVIDNQVGSSAYISAFAYAPSNDSIVYVAFSGPDWNNSPPLKKLFKTTNQWAPQPVWIDISNNQDLNCLSSYYILDMVVSPTNPDKIWLTLSGIPWSDGQNRVLRSIDGGENWEDYSYGLKKFPVHCIRYKTGSPDGLYVGTDVGVYYTDSTIYSINGWVPFNKNLPNPIVQDIEIIDSLNLIRIATFGRGIWEADLNCGPGETPTVITSDGTWEDNIGLDGDLIIKQNVTLTIRCEVAFPATSKLIVERGATLILDGGKLTSRCSQMWQGVEVWGDRSLPQIPTTSHYQGMIIMQNNAVIENARFGITTSRSNQDGSIIWDYTGGIVLAANSLFLNNFKAVQFLSYQQRNISAFTQCRFEINTPLPGWQNGSIHETLSLYDVSNITFKGCSFKNSIPFSTTGSNGLRANDRGAAISCVDAEFTIKEDCRQVPCPDSIATPTVFDGYYYGIKDINTNPSYQINITLCEFLNNYRGIYMSGADFPSITKCHFDLPVPKYIPGLTTSDTLYCLYLDNCTGYQIEENKFVSHAPNSNNWDFVGLVINNSGDEPNEVYNNHFDSIDYAIVAQNQNRTVNTNGAGLCLKCNDFSNTRYDMIMVGEPTSFTGIALNQGGDSTIQSPAGNTFAQNHSISMSLSDIDNEGSLINYYHHASSFGNERVRPDYIDTIVVKRKPVNFIFFKETACPSRLNSGGAPPGEEELKSNIAHEDSIINPLEQQLAVLVDGGNTYFLNDDVMTSIPPEALEIRNDLLAKSPYLSDTVLKTAITKEDVLPNAMIRDVLVVNPQSAKSTEIMNSLSNRFIPMPDTMMAEILSGENIISVKETFEAEINAHKINKARNLGNLIRLFRTDTINPTGYNDSLMALYNKEQTPNMKYRLAFEFFAKGDTVNLNSTLANIPQMFDLDNTKLQTHLDYLEYFNFLKSLKSQGKCILEIDSLQIFQLLDFASRFAEPIQSYVRNILVARGKIVHHEIIILPDQLKSTQRSRYLRSGGSTTNSLLKIAPNPAKQYAIISYNLNNVSIDKRDIIIQITNMEGKILEKIIASKSQDQIIVVTESYKPGTYLCSLLVSGKLIETKRIVIIK